jgi:hypothetical protein
MPTKTAVLLLTTILILALVPTAAMAAGGPPDGAGSGNGNGQKGQGDRNVEVEMEPQRARIHSTAPDGDGSDALGYQIEAQNHLEVEMQYKSSVDSEKVNVQMTVRYRQIIEYEDEDGNGQLDPVDEVVSTYDLETQYEELEHVDEEDSNGKMFHMITARTRDGVFAMVTYTSETQAQTPSGEVSPNLMKIDLVIEGFPYIRTTTRLALQATVETQGPITLLSDVTDRPYLGENEGGIEAEDGDNTGFYTWVRSAEVNGNTQQVKAQVSNDGDGTNLYFNYAHGDSIIHDPKLGVTMLDEGLFDVMERLLPYLAALGAGAIVIGAAVHWRKRQD